MNPININLLSILFLALLFTSCESEEEGGERQDPSAQEESFESLYDHGMEYETYIADLQNEKWRNLYENSEPIREDLLAGIQVVPGSWKLLVFNEGESVDAVHTISQVARLANRVESLELRVSGDSEQTENIADRYRTYDGRSAYPVILLLDGNYREVGCWVERPAELQRSLSDRFEQQEDEEVGDFLADWYRQNRGVRTMDEIIRIVRAANAGEGICPVPKEGLRGS